MQGTIYETFFHRFENRGVHCQVEVSCLQLHYYNNECYFENFLLIENLWSIISLVQLGMGEWFQAYFAIITAFKMVLNKKFNSFTNYDEGTTYQRDLKNEQEEE